MVELGYDIESGDSLASLLNMMLCPLSKLQLTGAYYQIIKLGDVRKSAHVSSHVHKFNVLIIFTSLDSMNNQTSQQGKSIL